MAQHPIIALWSHPRSMSTAFERVMRARGDLDCLHEPFMYDYYVNRACRVMPHFDVQPDHPRTYEAIRDHILARGERGPVFFKDMSYYVVPHILDDEPFLRRLTHTFLIRDPVASIVSYAKLDPEMTLDEIGLEAQWRHAERLRAMTGKPPIVVESERVRSDPAGQMRRYWQALGLSDKPDALEWEGEAPRDWQQVAAWHADAMRSKTIRPVTLAEQAEASTAFAALVAEKPHMKAFHDHHAGFHRQLAQFAL